MIDLDAGMVLDWSTTTMWADELGLHLVPVISYEDDYQNAVTSTWSTRSQKTFQLRVLFFVMLASFLLLISVSMS